MYRSQSQYIALCHESTVSANEKICYIWDLFAYWFTACSPDLRQKTENRRSCDLNHQEIAISKSVLVDKNVQIWVLQNSYQPVRSPVEILVNCHGFSKRIFLIIHSKLTWIIILNFLSNPSPMAVVGKIPLYAKTALTQSFDSARNRYEPILGCGNCYQRSNAAHVRGTYVIGNAGRVGVVDSITDEHDEGVSLKILGITPRSVCPMSSSLFWCWQVTLTPTDSAMSIVFGYTGQNFTLFSSVGLIRQKWIKSFTLICFVNFLPSLFSWCLLLTYLVLSSSYILIHRGREKTAAIIETFSNAISEWKCINFN